MAQSSARAVLCCATAVILAALPALTLRAATADFLFADSFDVDLTSAFFVSPQGLDTNPGTRTLPFQTITKGIAAAAADPLRKTVAVAIGSYAESVVLADGVGVYGHFQAGSWARDSTHYSVIDGVSSEGNHDRTVIAANIVSATTFDGFVVDGPANAKVSGNSYAVYVSGSNANLQITHNIIFAGHAGPGAHGATGPDGLAGVAGSGRNTNLSVSDPAYDAFAAIGAGECNASNDRQYANGGALSCGGTAVNGGNGGGNRCPVMSYCDVTDPSYGCLQTASSFHWSEYTAIDGAAGTNGGANGGNAGTGAYGGDDMIQVWANAYGSYLCYLPTDTDGDGNNTFGLDGANGGNAGNAAAVAGCAAAAGSVVDGHWIGGSASGGMAGANGGGGGGGGAGGGSKCQASSGPSLCTDGTSKDSLGGHGGGGGSGGCGGAGGEGGGSGGGAFGIFIVGSGAAPVVSGNSIFGGSGGAGGAGGNGGSGGPGGLGALGGTAGVPLLFCTDAAGRGGDGGAGGYGSGGGGGCGGGSFGIYTSGVGTPNYCDAIASNTIAAGAPGVGGSGGLSQANPGGAGADGTVTDCSFH